MAQPIPPLLMESAPMESAVHAQREAASLAEAHGVLDLVPADPRRALAMAEALLGQPRVSADARAVTERAAALAELDLGRVVAARRRFERARDRALADGLISGVAEIRIGLAIALLDCEEPDAAMAELDAALALATDEATLGRVQSQRATILMRLGRYAEALEQATTALATCRSAGLLGPVARLLSNQGIVHAYLGDYTTAGAELQEALQLLRREGSDLGAANALHNLGFVAGRQGDVPLALAHFDEAFAEYVRLDVPQHAALVDRCEVLLSVRLLPEARAAADEAVAGLERAGRAADLAEARLMLAEVALASGDLETAGVQASRAAVALTRQGRAGWAALARFVAARARWAAGSAHGSAGGSAAGSAHGSAAGSAHGSAAGSTAGSAHGSAAGSTAGSAHGSAAGSTAGSAHGSAAGSTAGSAHGSTDVRIEAAQLAPELEAAGWRAHGLEARIASARAALASNDGDGAIRVLAPARPDLIARTSTSSEERVRALYALALQRLAAGERGPALQALKTGLQIAEEHSAAFGATELRARAATRSAELAELGLELVLESGDAAGVLEWCERWRARSLWPPDVIPPADTVLAEHLARLRHTVAALELAVQAGDSTAELASRRHELESAIRRRSLRSGSLRSGSLGDGSPASRRQRPFSPIPTLAEVQASLARSNAVALVELLSVRGNLHAVVCTQRACVVRELAPVADVDRWRAAARFALGRLVLGQGSEASLVAVAELLLRAAAETDSLVLGPIADVLGDAMTAGQAAGQGEIVIVPTGGMHSMPWGLLPGLQGRPVSVVPSAAMFTNRAGGRRRTGPTVLVAAPGVSSGEQEVEAIGRLYSRAVTLGGRSATAARVATEMAGAAMAHIVAHGRFRMDNALFSALELADGPLTVYELEEIGLAPELLVLSACDGGRTDVQPGDELMGMVAAMLSLGSRAIVASVVPVSDAGAPEVMVRFHELLLEGDTPSAALARTQAEHRIDRFHREDLAKRSSGVLEALAAVGFVCFGTAGCGPETRTVGDGGGPRVRMDRLAAKITK